MAAATQPIERIREVARFSLPIGMPVAVLVRPGIEPPTLDAATWPFPRREAGPRADEGDGLVDQLELLRERGAAFLLIPAAEIPYLERHGSFRAHVEREYREVLREDGVCAIFALHGIGKGNTFRPPDGLPLPPPEMTSLTVGLRRPLPNLNELFYRGGATTARSIRDILRSSGRDIGQFGRILDFGCGCGRVIRHFRSLRPARLHGCDYNPYLVDWCRANLPFGDFEVNGLGPPLGYPEDTFDLLYGMSVFTHLDEEMQLAWIAELTRVVRPGGLLLLTFQGRTYAEKLDEEKLGRFRAGELVISQPSLAGTNACAAFHPEPYIRGTLARGLKVLAFVREGHQENGQDAVLLERPAR